MTRTRSILETLALLGGLLALVFVGNAFGQSSAPYLYLPLVLGQGIAATATPVPTATATPTNTPTATPEPTGTPAPTATPTRIPSVVVTIPGGDFESGQAAWQRERSAYIVNSSSTAHTGSWHALLGGSSSEDSRISQRVTVPGNASYLVYWDTELSYQAGCYYDSSYVWIDPNPDDTAYSRVIVESNYNFCNDKEYSTYREHSVDLRAYAGQTVELEFDMSTNSGYASYWSIDDVIFRSWK